jgi:deoxyribodipyrimidine photo-lyase
MSDTDSDGNGIHIFRKDFRLNDNISLYEISKKTKNIYLFFHLNTFQVEDKKTEYFRSYNAINFMLMSLDRLNSESGGKLNIYKGSESEWINYIREFCLEKNIKFISANADFTKYSIERDNRLKSLCKKIGVQLIMSEDDQSLIPISLLNKKDGSPYGVFHYFNSNFNQSLDKLGGPGYVYKSVKNRSLVLEKNITFLLHIGTGKYLQSVVKNKQSIKKEILQFTDKLSKPKELIQNWDMRDDLSEDRNTYMSAYLNFGVFSIRQIYSVFNKLKGSEEFIKQLIWRDFYLCILKLNNKAKEYIWLDDRYNKIQWRLLDSDFKHEWDDFINCDTGCLLVDAAMSELKNTGFMSNRCRLIWATYTVKYLQSDPFDKNYGAINLFSRYLIDCTTSQNKMNFEWIISSLDLGGRRFSKKGCSPLTGRMMKVDNSILKKYNAFNYVRKWLVKYKNMSDKELIKIKPKIDLEERYRMFCIMFKSL